MATPSAPTRWTISRPGVADELLECSPDGSGCLTRADGQVVRGRWKEDLAALRFTAPSGEHYQGRFDEARESLSKGLISRGVGRVIGRFTARKCSREPSLPELANLPFAPAPLPALPSSVQYCPDFISAEDEALLLENVRTAVSARGVSHPSPIPQDLSTHGRSDPASTAPCPPCRSPRGAGRLALPDGARRTTAGGPRSAA